MYQILSRHLLLGVFISAVLTFNATAAVAADNERGREVFKLCAGCHSIEPGVNLFGPSLAGVSNRGAGKLEGYDFSDELGAVTFKWDTAHLDEWLKDEPKNIVAGTRMEFPGISDPESRPALISYLETLR
jgi:cytochrome c